MGIAGFQRWLVSTFPEIVRVQGNKFGEVYDHVAFDLNQVLHQAARKASDRQTLAAAVFRELDAILKNCVPRKSIFFAFDGPGPVAKLVTQRKRRSRTRVEHVTIPKRKGRHTVHSKYAEQAIDRLELTPGVETLYFLRDAIEYWTYTRLQNDRKYAHVQVRISGPDIPGEGELKIIDFCRVGIKSTEDSMVVIGGDADIVLQGLATTPVRNFFVYLRNFGNHGKKRVNYVLSVWELTRSLEKLFPGDSTGSRLDFILFSTMSGNDYIPKARGVTLNRLWRRYVHLKTRDSKNNETVSFKGQFVVNAEQRTFNWPFLYQLLERVGNPVPTISTVHTGSESMVGRGRATAGIVAEEDTALSEEEDIVYTGDEEGVPVADLDDYSSEPWLSKENEISGDEDSSDAVSEEDEDNEDIDEDFVDEDEQHFQTLMGLTSEPKKLCDVERWLRVLLWMVQMYVDGHCADYTFQYGRPYGPSCDIITTFIDEHNGDPFTIVAPVSNAAPLKPHEAALAMLPKHATHLLPRPLRELAEDSLASKKIFPSQDAVDIQELVRQVSRIPESEYSEEEVKLTRYGQPLSLRISRTHSYHKRNPVVSKPGPRYDDIRRYPVIEREAFPVTVYPQCYQWPAGTVKNLLRLSYMVVGGARLTVLKRELRWLEARQVRMLQRTADNYVCGRGGDYMPFDTSALLYRRVG